MRSASEVLEFGRVLEAIAANAVTTSAKQKILSLVMSNDYYKIEEELSQTDEALRLCYGYGRCPIENVFEIQEAITRANKGATLNCEELYRIASQAYGINKVQDYLGFAKESNVENFHYLANSLHPVNELLREVNRCISPNLFVLDNASHALASIRKSIVSKEAEVRHKLETYVKNNSEKLSDSLITMRNDRLVIPVKNSFKYDFGGIIHDQSDSGQTFFVEPGDVVTVNTQLQVLVHEEALEIERILGELTNIVRENSEVLLQNFNYLVELDFLFAKAQYGKDINGKVATLSKEQEVCLIKARHPLLEAGKVVANDLLVGGKENKQVLITGPNTGGKTVALKTLGLIVMMNQAGLVIPVDFEAKLGIFDDIYVDIGDEQSIEQSLSTFSSHLSKLVSITNNVNAKSLVLVDELGGGTDPSEGEALAMAILNYFHQKDCLVVATTHYSNLKSFALEQGYITNASMLFDPEKFQPLYRLIYGVPGKSYAFMISRRLGLNESIIKEAENYQKSFQTESDLLITKLQQEIEEADKKEQELLLKEGELQKQLEESDKYLKEVQQEKQDLIVKSHEKIDELVEEATAKINKIIEETTIKPSSEVKLHEWIAAKKKLEDVAIFEIDEEKKDVHDYQVGETVFVPRLNKIGKITRKKGEEYSISVGKVSLTLAASELEKHEQVKVEGGVSIKAAAKSTAVKTECNLIGMHIEEAIPVLQKYLDDALLMHYPEVRIIHGCGTGVLRKAVHEYLDKQRFVKSYRLGGAGEGGVGATVVYFK